MDMNLYAMEFHTRQVLDNARRVAAAEARAGRGAGAVGQALRAAVEGVRARYLRWSSAASTGSKPSTVRAWSRSR